MRTFMAGASSTFLSVARSVVEARSSAKPLAALAIRPAVAGATTTRSAQRDSSIWPMAVSSSGMNRACRTGWPVRAASDMGVTNSAPAAVSRLITSAPAFFSRRVSSSAL